MTASHQRDLEAFIGRYMLAAAKGDIAPGKLPAVMAEALIDQGLSVTPRESIKREGDRLLDLYDAQGGDGNREAAGIVAGALAKGDPHVREILAQRVRTLARKRRNRRPK